MTLVKELGLKTPFENSKHEAILNVVLTGSMIGKEGDRFLKQYGLTDSQFNVLMLLKYQTEDGVMNQTALGDRLLVNRSNITGLVDRLEQAGYVKRFAQSQDRRVNLVKMTKAGKKVLESAEKAYYKRIEDLMKNLSDNECKRLCRLLEKIRKQTKPNN